MDPSFIFSKEGSVMYSVGCITIPASVKSINEDAFGWRKSIQCVTIPNAVTAIGAETFDNAPHLGYYGC